MFPQQMGDITMDRYLVLVEQKADTFTYLTVSVIWITYQILKKVVEAIT